MNKNFFPPDFFPRFNSSKTNNADNLKKTEKQKFKSKST